LKILITGGKSAGTLKLLKAFEGHEVILADYGDTPSFVSAAYTFLSLGEENDAIAHNLLNTCLDHGVECLLPLHEFEIAQVSKSSVLFEEFNITVLLPSLIDLPKFFYPLQEVDPKSPWAIFVKGDLKFPVAAADEWHALGKEHQLNGVFYIPEQLEKPTAILFTIK
jgi:hypothetical protein